VQLAEKAQQGGKDQMSDTLIGRTLSLLSNELVTINPGEALIYSDQLLALSEKLNHN